MKQCSQYKFSNFWFIYVRIPIEIVMYKPLQRLAEVSANWSAQALHVEKDLDVSDV